MSARFGGLGRLSKRVPKGSFPMRNGRVSLVESGRSAGSESKVSGALIPAVPATATEPQSLARSGRSASDEVTKSQRKILLPSVLWTAQWSDSVRLGRITPTKVVVWLNPESVCWVMRRRGAATLICYGTRPPWRGLGNSLSGPMTWTKS